MSDKPRYCFDGHRSLLGIVVIVGFFVFLWRLFDQEVPQGVHDLVLVFVTMLAREFGTIVDYFYGSSAGSTEKDRTISDNLKKPDTSVKHD